MAEPTPPGVLALAADHYAERRGLVIAVIAVIAEWWSYISRGDITGSYENLVQPGMLSVIVDAQRQAAAMAPDYLQAIATELGGGDSPYGDLIPDAWSGRRADGSSLEDMLDGGRIRTLSLIAAGLPVDDALQQGLLVAQRDARTETQDAGRGADQAGIAAQPLMTGYVRYLVLPSCSRCVALAGRWYRWSAGFQRHPRCDCLHVPTAAVSDPAKDAGNPASDPAAAVASGLVTGLSQDDMQAIADGADLGRVVNAKSTGLRVAGDGARRRGRRLTTDECYERANGDREQALELLRKNGYISDSNVHADSARGQLEVSAVPFVIPDTWEMGDTDSKGMNGQTVNGRFTYDPARLALHQQYYDQQTAGAVSVAQPEFHLMGGGAASGKSSIIRSGDVVLPDGHVLVNADEAKEALPEYMAGLEVGSPNAAAFAHEESSDMGKTLTSDSLRSGYNTVLDGVGNGSINNLAGKIAKARADGALRVVGDYVTVDTEEAVRRAVLRGERSGRFVPVKVIRQAHGAVSDTFREAVARGDLFDTLRLYDNNGETPRLIFDMVNGIANVLDPAAYESFLRKGPKYVGGGGLPV